MALSIKFQFIFWNNQPSQWSIINPYHLRFEIIIHSLTFVLWEIDYYVLQMIFYGWCILHFVQHAVVRFLPAKIVFVHLAVFIYHVLIFICSLRILLLSNFGERHTFKMPLPTFISVKGKEFKNLFINWNIKEGKMLAFSLVNWWEWNYNCNYWYRDRF